MHLGRSNWEKLGGELRWLCPLELATDARLSRKEINEEMDGASKMWAVEAAPGEELQDEGCVGLPATGDSIVDDKIMGLR